ncbi:excalibur calcium-binding domain-containing protein [Streptomyces ortus]|uniref:Excalibur calcium-binding domain-containing protein n=1 Tax=Streptomyces ortus TaxID=2867268 RepID=A0ABT3UW09_9ACTN|nr:excalibur calcium-binding domain-containing protein [Streptomyces ortus]MCX4231746.1 excalibur calcium-binding domain-containing protein [Streptomyces ortus]
MGLPGRIFTAVLGAVVGLFVLFVALGGILAACGAGDEEPRAPATSSPVTTSEPAEPDPTSTPAATPTDPVSAAETPPEPVTASPTFTSAPRPAEPDTTAPEPSREPRREETTTEPTREETTAEPPPDANVYYENCDAARDAGAAPVYRGDPGYGPHLDRDGDGVACEPYAGP